MIRSWFEIDLWKRILLAMVVGIVVGVLWGEGVSNIRWMGDLFLRLIRMVVVPLVFVTLVSGMVSMGDPSRLGSLGVKTLAVYMLTTLFAITIGLFLAAVMQPGVGIDLSGAASQTLQEAIPLSQRLLNIVPNNPFAALAEGDFLATIFFAIVTGVSILVVGDKAKPLADIMDAGTEVMLKITHWVMEVAPFGAMALIATITGSQGVTALFDVVTLAMAVILGCVAHVLLVHGSLLKFVLKLNPIAFFRGARSAMLLAFSTSSSSATLPVSMTVAEEKLGIKPVVASTVLPLGATINMDGTALYVGVGSVFGAQAFGVDLALVDYLLIAGATTLVSVGTAGVPGASLFLMSAVMDTIGMTPAQIGVVIGFILPFDRPLDMLRTSVNVTGDLAVATAVANWEGEFDKEIFDRPDYPPEAVQHT
ncbi:MAG: dicarboxylate:amino acid:cation symporter DAACS family protein [Pseudohongiella sp.]|nr:MAG: dicarboxylate:amino acid:cation symporter DAACS family protein [Pseudohongiella sp.]